MDVSGTMIRKGTTPRVEQKGTSEECESEYIYIYNYIYTHIYIRMYRLMHLQKRQRDLLFPPIPTSIK